MKFLIRATIPNQIGNKLVDDSSFLAKMEDFIKNTRAESAFFTLYEGERTAFFTMDIDLQNKCNTLANHCSC